MPKAENTFRPIGDSDQKMHGLSAVLVSGFSADEQKALRAVMNASGLQVIPAIYITAGTLNLTLAELAGLPTESNAGETTELPRALVLSGLTERQLHAMMDGYRESGLPRPLWASVTPTSSNWSIKYLLIELLKERDAMRQAREAEQQRNSSEAAAAAGGTANKD